MLPVHLLLLDSFRVGHKSLTPNIADFLNENFNNARLQVPDPSRKLLIAAKQNVRVLRVGAQPSWYVRTALPKSRLARLPKIEATQLAPASVGLAALHGDVDIILTKAHAQHRT